MDNSGKCIDNALHNTESFIFTGINYWYAVGWSGLYVAKRFANKDSRFTIMGGISIYFTGGYFPCIPKCPCRGY